MRYSIIFFFFTVIFMSCLGHNSHEESKLKGEIITVHNPINISVNDLILEYDTIRLEAKEDSYIAEISKMEILDNYMYIWDYKQKTIFIFSCNGNFISKINDKGEGPNQYISINSFEIDCKNKEIILSDSFSNRIFIYDKEGKQLKVVKSDIYPLKIAKQGDLFINFYTGVKNIYDNSNLEENMIHFINSNGEFKHAILNKPQGKQLNITPFRNIACLQNSDILFQPLLDYSIYKINNENYSTLYTLENKSNFKFLNNSQKKDISLIVNKENDLENLEKKGYLLPMGNMINIENYIFLYLGYAQRTIIYYSKNKKKSITMSPYKLQGDEVQKTILSLTPKAGYKDKVYIALDYIYINNIADKVSNNKLKTFFKNTQETDNPCIITYKIKDI